VNVFAAAVVALVVSFIGTRLALALANKHQLTVVPNARSSHAVPTPSAGGIGICLAVIVGLTVALLGGTAAALGWVAASTALAGWVGWRDDVRPLSPLLKMALLTVAAGALLLLGQLDGVTLPLAGRLDFGTLAVYCCTACCEPEDPAQPYQEEFVWIQPPEEIKDLDAEPIRDSTVDTGEVYEPDHDLD